MQVNLPTKVRATIYVLIVIGTALFVPLNNANVINDVFMSVWTSVSAAASALALFNVKDTNK